MKLWRGCLNSAKARPTLQFWQGQHAIDAEDARTHEMDKPAAASVPQTQYLFVCFCRSVVSSLREGIRFIVSSW